MTGVNVGVPLVQLLEALTGFATSIIALPPNSGNASVMLKFGIATLFVFATVSVNVDALPPSVTVDAEKALLIAGLLNANTLILWLTAPTLETAAPSLPVTALFATLYV